MLELLTDITEGRGTMKHLDMLEELAETISDTALCGLGKTAAFPVVSTMKYFRDEYIAHVVDKKCPAGQCKALVNFSIDPDLCKGCTKCARLCPVSAISGELKKPHTIDVTKCIGCGVCAGACPSGAISMVPVEYPPQQKKELFVLAQAQALTGNKAREEQMARQLAQVVQAPGLYRLLKAVERSARLVQEDLHRESGYMLPQSKNAHDLLKQLLENPPTPEFPRETAQALLEKLPQNEA